MLKIREAIVVEGRYDKNTLSQLVDTVILETSGFAIFKDRETLALLRKLGSYSIACYTAQFDALDAAGALELLPDGSAILTDLSKYNAKTGLALNVETGFGLFV